MREFRERLHDRLGLRAGALSDLTEAIVSTGAVPSSPVHLILQPVHPRGWRSLYAALSRGRIDAEALSFRFS